MRSPICSDEPAILIVEMVIIKKRKEKKRKKRNKREKEEKEKRKKREREKGIAKSN